MTLPKPKDIKDKYDIDPLKEIYYKIKEKHDMYYALALRKNITNEFFQFAKRQLDRDELINLNISGRTRSSKSTDASVIVQWINLYLSKVKGIEKKFDVEKIFCFNASQFLNKFNKKEFTFHDTTIIDEKRTYEAIQSGSMYEAGQIEDIDRIGAKLCLHRINIVGSYDDIANNAFYSLVTYGKNYKTFVNKLLVYTREENERVPLGYIELPVTSWLCKDIQEHKVTDCITCPLYKSICQLDKAKYERLKDKNIERTTQGGLEERTEIKMKISYAYYKDKEYMVLKNNKLKKIYIKDSYHKYTNRRLTIDEINEICDRVELITHIKKKKETKGLDHYGGKEGKKE